MKRLLIFALAAIVALLPVSLARAGLLTIDVGATTLTVSKVGDIKVELVDGMPKEIEVIDREYTGMGIGVTINDVMGMGDVLVTSNLKLHQGSELMFDHEGTIDFTIGGDMLNLEYDGMAHITKDMMMHTKTIMSHGDFKVVDGTGMFEGLKGVEGAYKLTIVEHGLKVGSMADFTFSAMEVAEVEAVE